MKLKIWVGPLIAVLIIALMRQIVYDAMENDKQRSVIPAVIEKKPEINAPMAGTRLHIDSLGYLTSLAFF